ncbi:LD-carboxypeptidase [Paenisporosarcina sp. TG20]|uniref:S66 peptidase family protein n=1 Tax=Paenisporosarcina sp. TG20 TaxID=1211706 RepID=UPI0002E15972|nr:LD-carboxypeptidase [Paenisporosarcina sp. TG20]
MRTRPARLQKGDTIGIIAPSSPPKLENLHRSLSFIENLGLKIKMGKHVEQVNGYLAGTDDERLADLHDMLKDPDVKAIICAGGGYGAARYADRIDYQLMAEQPKILWGYSDITFLHTTIGQFANIVTFHGPMLASDVGKDSFHDLSARMFNQLFEPSELHYSEEVSPLTTLVGGVSQGELVGGNLSLLVSALGTKYEIDTRGKLLLIEDVGEEPYRVDGMLNQLRLAGKFADAAGIVIGDFSKPESTKRKVTLTLEEVFQYYFNDLSIPVVSGFKIGHCQPHFAVPLGVEARLDGHAKTLTILPGVE